MTQAIENLRFLFWRNQVELQYWASHLAAWLKSDLERAEELLSGDDLRPDEQEAIAQATGVSVEELTRKSLIVERGVNIVQANIRFLTDNLNHGDKKRLSAAIDIHPSSLSKWRSGDLRPRKSHLNALCRYFALPQAINLETDLLFLSGKIMNIGEREERAWVQTRIMALDSRTWHVIFPALKLILAAKDSDVVAR